MLEFLKMGGYAYYVWTSYAVTVVLLAGIVIWSARQFRNVRDNAIRRAQQHRQKT